MFMEISGLREKGNTPHAVALQLLCRVCGGKLTPTKKRRTVYVCADYKSDLLTTFAIDVNLDDPQVHPPHFCHCCKVAVYNFAHKGVTLRRVCTWEPHCSEERHMSDLSACKRGNENREAS